MANNKSAEKRIEINKRNRLQNRFYKSSVRTLIKVFFKDLEFYKTSKTVENKEKVNKSLSSVYSLLIKEQRKKYFIKMRLQEKKQN